MEKYHEKIGIVTLQFPIVFRFPDKPSFPCARDTLVLYEVMKSYNMEHALTLSNIPNNECGFSKHTDALSDLYKSIE